MLLAKELERYTNKLIKRENLDNTEVGDLLKRYVRIVKEQSQRIEELEQKVNKLRFQS